MGDPLEATTPISLPCGEGALKWRALLRVLHRGHGRTFVGNWVQSSWEMKVQES
jgi:hypothetical protein